MSAGTAKPVLRIIRGSATPEEIAAVVAVLTSRAATSHTPADEAPPSWGRPTDALRRPLCAGPGAWRASGLPQ